jgi:DNA-binding response OmpR family regulator
MLDAARAAVRYTPAMERADHVLVVDDDAEIRKLLGEYLERNGFRVSLATDGAEMRRALERSRPDLVVLDLMLPGESGLTLCRDLRVESSLPVIMLTARAEEVDRIVGLEMGADDYVPKPFDPRELVARVRSVLRRTAAAGRAEIGAERVRIGRCVLDIAAHRLTDEAGVEVAMSPLEFDLLKALAEHPNRALSRERILNLNQPREWDPLDRSVDLRVMRLRKKIEPDPEHPRFIRTVRHEGYIFVPEGARGFE